MRRYGVRRSAVIPDAGGAGAAGRTRESRVPRASAPAPQAHTPHSSAMTPSMVGTVVTLDAPHATDPPRTPPSAAPAPMRPTTCLTVCGSNASLTTDQNTDTIGALAATM